MPDSRRIVLVHLIAVLVLSFLGTFTLAYVLEPSRFWLAVIVVAVPVVISTSAMKNLVMALDVAEERSGVGDG
ncbi:MAG: hypothetical protein GWN39_20745 [Thermoplasmata archaeon]|nr:hypothetical protein [Thermoplasmata archaeon]NIS14553.1 hypothetical protein [Thermoplasmata archaeon]NIV81115.1 hypothetical protein [Thermoplasmata archaeon]NIW91249.1 hypothetical protein [Thermoplasmata archaeon]